MFKEKYKLDNERITPSNELLESLASKMKTQQEEMALQKDKEDKKSFSFNTISKKYKSAAAIIILFILSFSTYELMKDNNLIDTKKDLEYSTHSAATSENPSGLLEDKAAKTDENDSFTIAENKDSKSISPKISNKSTTKQTEESSESDADSNLSSTLPGEDTPTSDVGDNTDSSDGTSDDSSIGMFKSSQADESVSSENPASNGDNSVDSTESNNESSNTAKESAIYDSTDNAATTTQPNSLLAASSPHINLNESDVSSITVLYANNKAENEIKSKTNIASIITDLQNFELSDKADSTALEDTKILTMTFHMIDNTLKEITLSESAIKVDGIWYTAKSSFIKTVKDSIDASIQ
jgi:hypothetical protein